MKYINFKLSNVVLNFPNLVEPTAPKGGTKLYYNTQILLDDEKKIQDLKSFALDACKAKWGEKGTAVYKELVNSGTKNSFHSGNLRLDSEGNVREHYKDKIVVKAKSLRKPQIIKSNRVRCTEDEYLKEAERFYSGCYANVLLSLSADQNDFGKFLYINLTGIQFAKDGEKFGGSFDASSEFEIIENTMDDSWDDLQL